MKGQEVEEPFVQIAQRFYQSYEERVNELGHIIDVAGQKIFNSIAIDLIKDVNMCVLVYDVT